MMKSLILLGIAFLPQNEPGPTPVEAIIERAKTIECDSAVIIMEAIEQPGSLPLKLQAELSLQKGMSYYCLGNFVATLQNYQDALRLFGELNDPDRQSLILNLMGTLHKKQGDMDRALRYFQEGMDVAEKAQSNVGIGNSLNNIGLVYFQSGEIDHALSYFLKSNTYKMAENDTLGLSYNYDNIAQVYSTMGKLDSAIYYFELAIVYKQIVGEGTAIVKNNLGEALMMAGNVNEAEPHFLEALEVAHAVGFADFESHVLLKLSEVYEVKQNYKASLDYFRRHTMLSDSLFNIRKATALSELETQYETEKKEQQIALQASEIAEQQAENQRNLVIIFALLFVVALLIVVAILNRSRTKKKQALILQQAETLLREAEIEAAISSQEKERARFAQDLHDGFGQMISILNLNLKSLEKESSDRNQVFEQSVTVLEDMYRELKAICFNLMPQTLISNGISAAINEFAARVNQTGKVMVETDFFGLDERLTDLQEISLYRITQEWVNNIMKYSDAERVMIQITRDQQELTLMIEDNGSGFDPEMLYAGAGNGWKNMNSRTNLIKGELELDTIPGMKGNTLILNAPAGAQVPIYQAEESLG